jgi:hypothetical protein
MRFLPTALVVLALSGLAIAFQEQAAKPASAPAEDAQLIAKQLPSYPLNVCPISKESLDAMGKPMDMIHEGRLVRLCCKSCVKEFKKDPAPILKSIDEGVVKAQKAAYPLKTCVVSGEALGDGFDIVAGIGIQIVEAAERSMVTTLQTTGVVSSNETRVAHVSPPSDLVGLPETPSAGTATWPDRAFRRSHPPDPPPPNDIFDEPDSVGLRMDEVRARTP